MVKIKEKERAIIEFTCIPNVSIEKAQELYDIGFVHLSELLDFVLDDEAKAKGLLEILNYRILSQFLSMSDEEIPTMSFKCPFCKGTVYGDEDNCSDCGALLLEEILDLGMEDVYSGLLKMIEAIIENPDAAKSHLEGLRNKEVEGPLEKIDMAAKEIVEIPTTDRGFVVLSIVPEEEGKNYLIAISPLGEHGEERERTFEDLKKFGNGEAMSFSIDSGNITNKQEEAVKSVVSKLIKDQDLGALATHGLFIVNLKIAKFLESKPTVMIEDNRHFMSSFDEIGPDDPNIEDIKTMLYDTELIKEIRKTEGEFVLDGVSFNNDPISFLLARECIPILRENEAPYIRILDLVVNTNYVDQGSHNQLLQLVQNWEK